MVNHFIYKLLYKLWLIDKLLIIRDIKPQLMVHLIRVEKHRTFRAPKAKDLLKYLHVDKDGYPIHINKDGIVFQHVYKIPLTTLKFKIHKLVGAIKYHNNVIYNYNYYRDDCYFIINMNKSYIHDVISIKPIKMVSVDAFYCDIFYDYKVICC